MNIEIIGNKSSNQMKLLKNIKKAIDMVRLDKTPRVLEILNTNKYKIKNLPALIINDNLVSEGKVLTEKKIARYIKAYA